MFFFLSKSLDLAVSPIVWVIALVALALGHVVRRSERRTRIVGCLVGALAVLLVFGNPNVADRIWVSLEEDAPSSHDEAQTYDAVVLLGGVTPSGLADPARPSYGDNVERLLVTYDLLRTNRAKNVIISGGASVDDGAYVKEASALGAQLEKWGIARDRIVIDDVAMNTRENAIESARLIEERGFGKVVLVTSAFHMQRAAGCFRAVDVTFDTLPVDYRVVPARLRDTSLAPRTSALARSGDALRELLGRRVYSALGYSR